MLLFYILTWLKTTIKENIITKLQKLYSLPKNLRVDNKLSVLFLKKPLHTGNLWPAHKIFIERSVIASFVCIFLRQRSIGVIDSSSSIVLVGMDFMVLNISDKEPVCALSHCFTWFFGGFCNHLLCIHILVWIWYILNIIVELGLDIGLICCRVICIFLVVTSACGVKLSLFISNNSKDSFFFGSC